MSQEQAVPDPILALPSFNDESEGGTGGVTTPWWRRRRTIIVFAILLLIVLLAAILLPMLNRSQPVTYQYQKASRGSLSLTVSATGPIQSGIYNLVFSGSGVKIDSIYVKVGQSVKKGDKLAQLDKTALQDALDAAQASYLSAQANYNSAQNTYNQTQGQLQSSINSAQTTLSNAMDALTKTQAQSQASVNGALQTLTNDQVALTNTQQSSQDSIASAQTALSNDQKALQAAQREAQTSNSAARQSVTNAQNALNSARNQANAQTNLAQKQYNQSVFSCQAAATPTATNTPIPGAYQACLNTAQATLQQTDATANANVVTAQNSLSAAQKQLTSTQATSNANITTAQGHVSADQKALNTAQTQAQTNNQAAQAKISSDQAALTTSQTTSASSNTTAQNSVNSAQSGLKSAQSQAGATGASSQGQVVTAQGQVNSALQSVTTAKHNLDNALLTAPHDGIVTTVNGTVGGTPGTPQNSTSTGTTTAGGTFIQLVDTSALQIQANINETDTANLKVGEVSTFTVNAYGNRTFTGKVASISPNGQTTSNVVTYPVSIDVDMTTANLHDATLLPGMTANITVTVLNRDNVLTIPVDAVNYARLASTTSTTSPNRQPLVSRQETTSALRQARQRLVELTNENPQVSNDNPLAAYVLERVNGQFVIKPVVLGLTDGTVYEVLDGLNDNEVIVVGASTGGAKG